MRFNGNVTTGDCLDPRGVGHVREVLGRILDALGVPDPQTGERRIMSLIRRAGLRTFADFPEFDPGLITRDVMSYDRFGNNPRQMRRHQLESLVRALAAAPRTVAFS